MPVALTLDEVQAVVGRWIAGGLVALPTETVYGLAADAGQPDAVHAIYRIKGRPADHPLIVHVAAVADARYWVEGSSDRAGEGSRDWLRFERLAARFWPGPLTMIVRRHRAAPDFACAGQPSIGLRCPSHPIARQLLRAFIDAGGRGIAAPSANRFGRISPTRAQHVRDEFGDADILVIDGGDAEVGLESTIVDLTRDAVVLLRPGAISLEALSAALAEPVTLSANVIDPSVVDSSAPRVSGSLVSHYAPATRMIIVERSDLASAAADAQARGRRVVTLECNDNAAAYARQLYARLRALDDGRADLILVQAPPRDQDWQAIWDRLLRAQSPVDKR